MAFASSGYIDESIDASAQPFISYMKEIAHLSLNSNSKRVFVSKISQNSVKFQSAVPVLQSETQHSYFDVTEAVLEETYFDLVQEETSAI